MSAVRAALSLRSSIGARRERDRPASTYLCRLFPRIITRPSPRPQFAHSTLLYRV